MTTSQPVLSKFDEFLRAREQQEWDRLTLDLASEVHEVDRQATRIWVAFWPLKLTRLLENSDQEAIIRDYRLTGNFRLEGQVNTSVSFLYGAKFWPQVKADLAARAISDFESSDLRSVILAAADRVSGKAAAERSQVVGICLAGHLMAAHIGVKALERTADQPASTANFHRIAPEQVCRRRQKQSSGGLLGFLRTADRQFKVRADPQNKGGFQFQAFQGQDLSMAAKSDTRDYRQMDPRRLEGPIPFECRSGSCGFCWVGVLSPTDRLEKITPYEIRRLKYFGYIPENAPEEDHPPIRLACQTPCWGDTQVVVAPWNGTLDGRV